jgi:tRNA pseudouridine55 synthase
MGRKKKGHPVHGWLVLDKPLGLSSTQALAKARWLLQAEKAGHAGTLDPLATGVLPLALGEATKTISYAVDGAKTYRFAVRFGTATTTDDAEGEVCGTSDARPGTAELQILLGRFTGVIEQVPPRFSAIKLGGVRAYALARAGDTVEMAPRRVRIERLALLERPDADHAVFEVDCGKGTYVRSLARDLAQAAGTVGHVTELRRTRVGPFTLAQAISLDELATLAQTPAVERLLRPIETVLDDIPALALTDAEAHRLRQGQTVALLRRSDVERLTAALAQAPADGGSEATVVAVCAGRAVALARLDGGQLRPVRVLNPT